MILIRLKTRGKKTMKNRYAVLIGGVMLASSSHAFFNMFQMPLSMMQKGMMMVSPPPPPEKIIKTISLNDYCQELDDLGLVSLKCVSINIEEY
jgi:hypothetical protein